MEKDNKWWKVGAIWLFFCIVGLGCSLIYNINHLFIYKGVEDNGVPRMDIKLNEVNLEEIKAGPKQEKYKGNQLDLYYNGQVLRYDDVEVKGRGNTTWEQVKKPYQIKLASSVNLLNLGKNREWVLLANYYDTTFLRNDIALLLAEMLEIPYNHRGEFVELYFDDEYEGLYYLVQKVEIANGSVNLDDDKGVLFEIENFRWHEEECYESYLGNCLVLKDTVSNDIEEKAEAEKDFLDNFNQFEKIVKKGDYKKISEIIDIESFAKYFIISELTVNPDAYSSSFYFYKDGLDDKIHAGPIWDYDLAFANHSWGWQIDESFYSPYEDMIRKREAFGEGGLEEDTCISKDVYYLMEIPEFRDEVKRIFQEKLANKEDELMGEIERKNNEIYEAVLINHQKWEEKKYEENYNDMLDWIRARYDYLKKKYSDEKEFIIDQRYSQFL